MMLWNLMCIKIRKSIHVRRNITKRRNKITWPLRWSYLYLDIIKVLKNKGMDSEVKELLKKEIKLVNQSKFKVGVGVGLLLTKEHPGCSIVMSEYFILPTVLLPNIS